MNKPLIAGDINFWIEGWSADKREAPLSFKYNENLLDLTWQFSIEVPDTDNYAFAKLPFKECRVYLNGDFFCGGYAIRFSEGDTSYNCEFIGYGYQVAKLTLLQSIQGTLPTNMALRDFLNLVISKNITSGKKIDINAIKVQDRLFSNLPFYDEFLSSQKSIRFYIYDPFDKGILPMDTYINIQKQNKKEKETNLLEYCSKVLKPFNIFIKCLGKKKDLTGIIDENKIYPQKISDYSSKEDVEEFVLMLWQPNSNNINPTTFKSQSYNNKTEYNSTAISNFTLSDENSFDSLKTEEKTYATFGFLKYKITPLMSDIKTIKYIKNSDDTTLFEKPKRSWDYSERYDTFVFSDTPDIEDENTKTSPNLIYLKDNDVKDGTTFFYKMDNTFKSEAVAFFAAYDMSIRKSKSFKVSCKAIGFHHENTIKMLREQGVAINKNKTIFGVNQIVRLQSPQQYLDAFFLIDGVSMSLDSSGGCYTNLSLVVPSAYSTVYYDDIEMEKDIALRLNLLKKSKIIFDKYKIILYNIKYVN